MAREIADTVLPRYKFDDRATSCPICAPQRPSFTTPKRTRCSGKQNSQTQRSIASITKVMTATVFLENNPDLTQPVTIARSDVLQASTTHLQRERQGHGRRSAAPAAHRVRQRGRAGAGADVALRLGRLHRSG